MYFAFLSGEVVGWIDRMAYGSWPGLWNPFAIRSWRRNWAGGYSLPQPLAISLGYIWIAEGLPASNLVQFPAWLNSDRIRRLATDLSRKALLGARFPRIRR
jgi:hypothetical protein